MEEEEEEEEGGREVEGGCGREVEGGCGREVEGGRGRRGGRGGTWEVGGQTFLLLGMAASLARRVLASKQANKLAHAPAKSQRTMVGNRRNCKSRVL